MQLAIKTSYVNASIDARIWEDGIQEVAQESIATLFATLQKEYGRCISPVYVEQKDADPKKIGWVFQKSARYENTGERYTQETWVEVYVPRMIDEVHGQLYAYYLFQD